MTFKWYKRNADDALNGMMILTLEERGAYNTILDLMYQRRGCVPDDARWLAGWLGCSLRKWSVLRASLLVKRKLFEVTLNGVPSLANTRVEKECASAKDHREGFEAEPASSQPRVSAENAPRTNKNNELEALEEDREKDQEKEDGEAIASLVRALGVAIESAVSAMKREAKRAFDQRFSAFWAAYPRRVKKPDALKAYTKAEERIGDDALAVILAGIERALPGWDDPKFIPHPATWLNACQWDDEPPQPRTGLTRNDRPDPRIAARQANYDAHWAGADGAAQVLAARRAF